LNPIVRHNRSTVVSDVSHRRANSPMVDTDVPAGSFIACRATRASDLVKLGKIPRRVARTVLFGSRLAAVLSAMCGLLGLALEQVGERTFRFPKMNRASRRWLAMLCRRERDSNKSRRDHPAHRRARLSLKTRWVKATFPLVSTEPGLDIPGSRS
jgi:hypothetical protein